MTPLFPSKSRLAGLFFSFSLGSVLWNASLSFRLLLDNEKNDYNDKTVPHIPLQQNQKQKQQPQSFNSGMNTFSTEDTKNVKKQSTTIVLTNNDDTEQTDVTISASTTSSRANNPPKIPTTIPENHQVAGLNCDRFPGGPYNEYSVQEMVYWEDIPTDATHRSPYYRLQEEEQFLTFEPDRAGWNNIRMAMETIVAIAVAMGRTLVLPPDIQMIRLNQQARKAVNGTHSTVPSKGRLEQKYQFSFADFFHFESITKEHDLLGGSVKVITMEEFLKTQALTGNLVDGDSQGNIAYPPQNNRTNWNGASGTDIEELYNWLRKTSTKSINNWHPKECVAIFPKVEDEEESNSMNDTKTASNWLEQLVETEEYKKWPTYEKYVGNPLPIDTPPMERLKEMWAQRKRLCIYTKEYQKAQWIHIPNIKHQTRLFTHFYAFVFLEDWKHDLWMKRFVRDHIRYVDEIQCAAARVVQAIRKRVKQRELQQQLQHLGHPNQAMMDLVSEDDDMEDLSEYTFDTFHIRRGDFLDAFPPTQVDAQEILRISQSKLQPNGTIYIATDEKNKTFFQPFIDANYDVVFLSDFMTELGDSVNSNYYCMIDQLIASRGLTFFGCWFSTLTGYVNRLRGYHTSMDHTSKSYTDGIIPSWYYTPEDRYDLMQTYYPVKKEIYAREYPTAWRLIDSAIDTSGTG